MARAQPQRVDAESPSQIWNQFPGITESKLFAEYLSRLTSGRDMHVVITAASETGVGKTTLAFVLALLWDQNGWHVDKATLSPRQYSVLYDDVDPGSVLILDEAEQAGDSRRGMSKENVALSHAFAAKRYRQVFGILTAPTRSWIDDRLGSDSADYWIQCLETDQGKPKGEAKVYRLKNNEHYQSSYTKRTETISWPPMDDISVFGALEEKKIERMEGVEESEWVHRDEVEDIKENFWNKSRSRTRFDIVRAMNQWGISQTDIADILTVGEETEGRSQAWVSQIVNAESFDEVYS